MGLHTRVTERAARTNARVATRQQDRPSPTHSRKRAQTTRRESGVERSLSQAREEFASGATRSSDDHDCGPYTPHNHTAQAKRRRKGLNASPPTRRLRAFSARVPPCARRLRGLFSQIRRCRCCVAQPHRCAINRFYYVSRFAKTAF